MADRTVKKKVGTDLTAGNIFSKLMIFAVPIILTNLIQQFYSMVDLAVVGKYVGSTGSVGVATGGEIADMITPVAMGLSTAGQILIAQLIGAKQEKQVKASIGTLLTMSFLFSLVLAGAAAAFCVPILHLLNCPAEAMGQAESYMIITALGYPFVFGYNAVVGILRGMGESKRPLKFICIAASVNIIADILLVKYFRLEAAGTAVATILSQAGSFIAAFVFMYRNREKFDFELKLSYFRLEPGMAGTLAKLAVPQIVRSLFVRFSMMWVNANVNSYGLTVSAANSIGNKIQKFAEVFAQGIDTAAAAMIGQNLGARKPERAARTTVTAWLSCLAAAAVLAVPALRFPVQIFAVMTKDTAVQQLGIRYLEIIVIHFFVSATTASFQAMVTGCGFVSLGFALGILDGVVCRIGISLFFLHVMHAGYESFWWGTAFSRVLPGVLCIAYFLSGKWKTRKLLTEK